MARIKDLSKEQWAKVPQYLNKWLGHGYRTRTTDRKKAKSAINFLYVDMLKVTAPKFVIFLDSPMACQLAANLIKNTKWDKPQLHSQLRSQLYSQLDSQLDSQLYSQLSSQLRSQLRSQLDSQLYSQLRSQLDSQLDSQLRSQTHSQLSSQLYSQLHSQLRSQLYSQLRSQLHSQLVSQLHSQLDSQLRSQLHSQLHSQLGSQLRSQKLEYFGYAPSLWWWPGWTGFYDYLLNEVFPDRKKEFTKFTELCSHWTEAHYYLLFPEIAFVSDYPSQISVDTRGRLHHETTGALVYRDGYAIHSLNGIRVPAWAIETPKDDIKPKQILELTNTEQRMALMKHVGLSKFLKELKAKEIDSANGYRLFHLNVEGEKIGPYLFMTCPSSGREFLEGCGDAEKYESVDPTIKTCEDALKWRAMRASQGLMTKFNLSWEYSS
jgi:hypothetical protein